MNGEDRKIIVELLTEADKRLDQKINDWREEHRTEIHEWRVEFKEDMTEVKKQLNDLPCIEHREMLGELKGCVDGLRSAGGCANPGNKSDLIIWKLLKKLLLWLGFPIG